MKRYITAIALFLLLPIAQAATSFHDTDATSDYFDAVMYAVENGIVSGYADGTFRENALINRAEFTKILVEFSGQEREDCDQSPFFDVKKDAWYAPYVCRAKQSYIIKGYSDGTFRPSQTITFAEAAKIIARTYAPDQSFSEDGVWYESYVRHLADKRVIPTSIVRFDHPMTRGEMTEIMFRYAEAIRYKPYQTYDILLSEGSESFITCSAYFEGFIPSYAENQCVFAGTSDCSNPFAYSTKQTCNEAFGFTRDK